MVLNSIQGEPIIRLGLIATLYFKHGDTAEIKSRVADCFSKFRKEFSPHLNWQFYKTLRKMSGSGFSSCRRKILESSPDQQFMWSISSARLQQVAQYRLFVMNIPRSQSTTDRSCLKMVLPWSILLEPGGPQRYEAWLNYLCNQVHAEHGYGGLSCTLPYDGQRYFPQEYLLAKQYIGLIVDPLPHVESLRLLDHIKGVNWFTVLGRRFVNKLGGNDALRRQLSRRSDIIFRAYDDGLIIRAGALPSLGGPGEEAPAPYIEVNRAIKPIRVRATGCLHAYSLLGDTFSEASSAAWHARFDEQPPAPLDAGERCTHTGYWSSNATVRSRCLFTEGDIMPTYPHLKGRTQWFWLRESE
ncbi:MULTISPECIES: DUF3396 domain-containing protein [unclassified Pseudomonas]|uniref:DUF3396 domain-containing protein n=1 Tax=unclassified Pseudomonas TaxID=196821 RepID=UPI002ACB140A|nr:MULTISPECIES: DUF3396 domain-containing protein [unclassified Pseudomonas]MEB0039038.1 DUF3396 domain-containing protein [Pseudomonas sp. MH10]MEB0094316.1 DUF3396 domain-containing protein [Pseudomonas sp. CCI4.2]MEB0120014.1 DUF3396 domain-containing protein [Pseudomonas sp. CCI1.2]WPX56421.1 DUF3396 domain-containing protein [Pseudomonas sp. CCI4.2]WPX66598.1 DUF3396 domain-containing protein [Pseudomonas sp. MH10]